MIGILNYTAISSVVEILRQRNNFDLNLQDDKLLRAYGECLGVNRR